LLKKISFIAIGLVAAMAIGCGGTAPPTNKNAAETSKTEQGKLMRDINEKRAQGDVGTVDEDTATALVPPKAGANAPKMEKPSEAPK
jgi:hypothetical protein